MIEMNAVAAGTELDAARDAGREGVSAGWCAWSAGDASLTFSLVVRPDVNMHAFHGLPFVAAMGMMDALVGTASTPGLGLAGKVGIQWPSDIVCGAPAFETSLARVAVNGGAGAAGMFAAVTVDVERAALGELGVDMADEALIEALAAAVLVRVDTWAVVANTPQGAAGPLAPVLGEYFRTGLVPRFPTLIVCCFVLVAALLLFISGIILSSQLAKDARDFEFQLQTVHHWHSEKK